MALEVPDDAQLGPAMLALNPRQRAFVIAMCEVPMGTQEQWAHAAGYGGASADSCRTIGHRLAHDERILAAVDEEARRRFRSGGILAVSRVMDLVKSNDEKIALRAALGLLDRTGLHALTEIKSTIGLGEDEKKLIASVIRNAAVFGLDPRALLGRAGVTVDAEFKVIEDKRPAEAYSDKEPL